MGKGAVTGIAFVACMLAAWWTGYGHMLRHAPSACDFESYFLAAGVWRQDGNPYLPGQLAAAKTDAGDAPFPYLYTPPAAQAVMPLASDTFLHAAQVWGTVNVCLYGICLFLCGLFCVRVSVRLGWTAGSPAGRAAVFLWALVCGLLFPFPDNLRYGQINPAVLFFILLYLLFFTGGKRFWAGVFLGVAAVIKIVPVFLLLAHLRSGRSFFAGFLSGVLGVLLVSVAVFGPAPWAEFAAALPKFSYGTRVEGLWELSVPYNLALSGQLARLFHDDARAIFAGGMAAGLSVAAYFALSSKKIGQTFPALLLQVSVAALLMVVFSPIAYFHHLVWLYPFLCCYGIFLFVYPLPRKPFRWAVYLLSMVLLLVNFTFRYHDFALTAALPFYFSVNTFGLFFLALLLGADARYMAGITGGRFPGKDR